MALLTRQQRQRMDNVRNLIMDNLGTNEALIPDHRDYALSWRKPLSIAEINQMAPTPEVRRREGRP